MQPARRSILTSRMIRKTPLARGISYEPLENCPERHLSGDKVKLRYVLLKPKFPSLGWVKREVPTVALNCAALSP